MGNWEGKLLDLEVVGEIGIGMICQHLEGVASVSVEGFGAGISLIGTEGGEGNMDEAAPTVDEEVQ